MHMLGMYVTARTVYLAAATITAGGLALTVFLLLILHDSGQRAAPRQRRPGYATPLARCRHGNIARQDGSCALDATQAALSDSLAAPTRLHAGIWLPPLYHRRPPPPPRWRGPRAVPDVDRTNDQVRRRYRNAEAEQAAAIRQAGGLGWP